ncbi:unnamed protein product [Calypogeia fissa]
MFWDVVKTLDLDLQRKFLKFVTGCSRGPLLGFKYLEPQFCIQSKEIIQEKLMYAITAGAGFDLSQMAFI